jgi:hypothetical protein
MQWSFTKLYTLILDLFKTKYIWIFSIILLKLEWVIENFLQIRI